MGIYADITRLSPETLRAIQEGFIPADAVNVDIKGLSFHDAFDAFGNQFSQVPGAQVQVFCPPESVDFSRLRRLDLHTWYSMILYQLSETFRREEGGIYKGDINDPIAGVIAGTFTIDTPLDFDPWLPLRGARPEEVASLSQRLKTISETDFLTVHRTEHPDHGQPGRYPYWFRDLSAPDEQRRYRNALHNLKAFYRTAADAGDAMLYLAS